MVSGKIQSLPFATLRSHFQYFLNQSNSILPFTRTNNNVSFLLPFSRLMKVPSQEGIWLCIVGNALHCCWPVECFYQFMIFISLKHYQDLKRILDWPMKDSRQLHWVQFAVAFDSMLCSLLVWYYLPSVLFWSQMYCWKCTFYAALHLRKIYLFLF